MGDPQIKLDWTIEHYCTRCGHRMRPSGTSPRTPEWSGTRPHAGRGICGTCKNRMREDALRAEREAERQAPSEAPRPRPRLLVSPRMNLAELTWPVAANAVVGQEKRRAQLWMRRQLDDAHFCLAEKPVLRLTNGVSAVLTTTVRVRPEEVTVR